MLKKIKIKKRIQNQIRTYRPKAKIVWATNGFFYHPLRLVPQSPGIATKTFANESSGIDW